jgi:hypothetical protein
LKKQGNKSDSYKSGNNERKEKNKPEITNEFLSIEPFEGTYALAHIVQPGKARAEEDAVLLLQKEGSF